MSLLICVYLTLYYLILCKHVYVGSAHGNKKIINIKIKRIITWKKDLLMQKVMDNSHVQNGIYGCFGTISLEHLDTRKYAHYSALNNSLKTTNYIF